MFWQPTTDQEITEPQLLFSFFLSFISDVISPVTRGLFWFRPGPGSRPVSLLSASRTPAKSRSAAGSPDVPADDDAVVKQVDLDVLDPDGLVEALWDQQPQRPPQVGGVVQRHAHLRAEALQQRQQHASGVDRPWNTQRWSSPGPGLGPTGAGGRGGDTPTTSGAAGVVQQDGDLQLGVAVASLAALKSFFHAIHLHTVGETTIKEAS